MKKLNLLLITVFTITSFSFAQNPQWMNYTNGDIILSLVFNNNITWVGTTGGLVHIDKITGIPIFYNKVNSGLPDNKVRSLAIDGNGIIWIGTGGGGLTSFDGTNWTVYNTSNSGLPDNDICSLTIDGNGIMWIGTYGSGLATWDGSTWTSYNTSNSGLPGDAVYKSVSDGSGTMWFATNDGVANFDGNTCIIFKDSVSG